MSHLWISFKSTSGKEAKYISRAHYFITFSSKNCNVHFRITKKDKKDNATKIYTEENTHLKKQVLALYYFPSVCCVFSICFSHSSLSHPFSALFLPAFCPAWILSFSPSLIRFLVGFAKCEVWRSFQKMENERGWIHLPLDLP